MSEKAYPLTLESDAFNSLKSDFNQLLRKTLSTMIHKEGEKAELKLSLKITLTQGETRDLQEPRYEAQREYILPKFEHKISTVMQYKDEKSGFVGGEEYELVWDKDKRDYVMKSIKDNQMNLFEYDDHDDYEYEDNEDNNELDGE
ncbi:MAG: hypothetical protein AB7V48_04430 [Sedimentibacter sp.]